MNFVQIGSNIGNPNDKLYEGIRNNTLKGLLVEPNPYAYMKLRLAYEGISDLIYDQSAISDHDGSIDLYLVQEELSKGWSSSSLDFMKAFGLTEDGLQKITVPCLTIRSLLTKHNILNETIDRLIIDTEGHDVPILLATDFSDLDIKEIIFEYIHVGGNQARGDLSVVLRHLLANGYRETQRTAEDIYLVRD